MNYRPTGQRIAAQTVTVKEEIVVELESAAIKDLSPSSGPFRYTYNLRQQLTSFSVYSAQQIFSLAKQMKASSADCDVRLSTPKILAENDQWHSLMLHRLVDFEVVNESGEQQPLDRLQHHKGPLWLAGLPHC